MASGGVGNWADYVVLAVMLRIAVELDVGAHSRLCPL